MVKHKLLFGFIFLFVCILLGCEDKERIYISEKMDHVELLLDNDRLDSAYNVLGNISSMIEEMGESESTPFFTDFSLKIKNNKYVYFFKNKMNPF